MGRPKKPVPPPRPPRELGPCDPKTIAPLSSRGYPDMINYMPTRLVPLDEAQQRGWPHFYEATLCRYGHQAPRFVSNPNQCVDCYRIKEGKAPISKKAGGPAEYKAQAPYTQRQPTAPAAVAAPVALTAPEPDRMEKQFLTAYASVKDFTTAAVMVGGTEAQFVARMAWSPVFREAVNQLEDSIGCKHTQAPTGPFEWTPEKRSRLLEVFVDTGDIATARDSIRVTSSEFFRELNRNPEFAAMHAAAQPLAHRALEDRAFQLALAGNDKLLQKVLTAKIPTEYGERVRLDVNLTEKLTDEQLNARIIRLERKYGGRVIEGEIVSDVPAGQAGLLSGAGREGEAGDPQPHSDLL